MGIGFSNSIRQFLAISSAVLACTWSVDALAHESLQLERVSETIVTLERDSIAPSRVWISADTKLDPVSDTLVAEGWTGRSLTLTMPATAQGFVLVQGLDGAVAVTGERALPLERASNFRDIGGYGTKGGKTVRWGRVYRSGAQPLLTEQDFAYVDSLGLGTVVDLRSIEERQIAPDQIDDRTRALFVSNDYSLLALMGAGKEMPRENTYSGMEKMLAPQLHALYRQIMKADGDEGTAVLYHCSAGQDRTGVATALLYDVLGVDRETILADYHLSTALRRPANEMPEFDPADFPGNPVARLFKKYARPDGKAEPLYTASGDSHLAQFFTYLDATYGGSEGYMKDVLGFSDADIAHLRETMLR